MIIHQSLKVDTMTALSVVIAIVLLLFFINTVATPEEATLRFR